METQAVVFERPGALSVRALELDDLGENDILVDVSWSGISTGTERMLWTGSMPPFPGMGYPLVPGYESVGRVREAGPESNLRAGDWVFAPGASCYGEVKGLFGGTASSIVLPDHRAVSIAPDLKESGVLLALTATAYHAIAGGDLPDLIIGHGVLGRLMARMTVALGGSAPTVWETEPRRRSGGLGYEVMDPEADRQRPYKAIYDVSGKIGALDELIMRLAPGGEIVLAGFYDGDISFQHVPAFLREARIRVAAEWKQGDLRAALRLVESGALSLDGLITHQQSAAEAVSAYGAAFEDPDCLKMILDWSNPQ